VFNAETNRYAIVDADSASEVQGTILKARSNTTFDSGYTEEELLNEIEESIGLNDVETDEDFFAIVEKYPEYFDDDLNFLTELFLSDNLLSDNDGFSADAFSRFNDTWLITGESEGESGVLSLFYQVDGIINSDVLEFEGGSITGGSNSGRTTLRLIETQTVGNTTFAAQADSETIFTEGFFDGIIELELDFIFGQSIDIGLSLTSSSGYDYSSSPFTGLPDDFTQSADFFNTAVFNGLQIRNSQNQLVDYSLVSSSGSSDFNRTGTPQLTPVNEPASALIFFMGLILVFRRKISVAI
jgi:hypothetical protein